MSLKSGVTECSKPNRPSVDQTEDPRTSFHYKTALELELWKEEKEKAFLSEVQKVSLCDVLVVSTQGPLLAAQRERGFSSEAVGK